MDEGSSGATICETSAVQETVPRVPSAVPDPDGEWLLNCPFQDNPDKLINLIREQRAERIFTP